jgi:hypothetical protein
MVLSWLKDKLGTHSGVGAAAAALLLIAGMAGFAVVRGGAGEATGPDPEPAAEQTSTSAAAAEASSAVASDDPEATGAAVSAARGAASGDTAPEVGVEAPAGPPVEAGPIARAAWASPREPSPVEPVPAEARVPKPAAVRGLYVGSWSAGSAARLESLIRLADETEINTFVVDIKEALGEVSHRTRVPLAGQVGADRNPAIGDMSALLARLREHGIYPIARIVVFKDPLLAMARPEWSIVSADGTLWADDKGVHWVDPFNRDVWDYNIELAREAVALGFSEIQWDYVRFPDVPQSYLRDAVYPAREGRTMAEGIREFLIYSRERLGHLGVPITADVFGVTTSAHGDVGIGQIWERMADVTDVLLPMVYPSHYPPGTWGYPRPNAEPYEIVLKALGHGVARSAKIPGGATIRPWLQAFSLGQPPYGPAEIRAQIDAVYDAGLTEWILWNPSARYTREALLPR